MAQKNSILGKKKYIIMIGDLVIFYFALYIALILRYGSNLPMTLWERHLWPFTAMLVIWLVVFYIDDLYELTYDKKTASWLNRIIRVAAICLIIGVGLFYFGFNRIFGISPQRLLIFHGAITFFALYIWRLLFFQTIKKINQAHNILFIGYNELVKEIIDNIKQNPQLGLKAKMIIDQSLITNESLPNDIKISQDFANLKNICEQERINTIVSSIHPRKDPQLLENLFDCIPLQIDFFDIANFYENVTGKIPVTAIEHSWFLENLSESSKGLYEKLKRINDIIGSIILLTASLPLIPFIALAIKFSGKGPVLFKQIRVGKDGKNFSITKFRTMVSDAEKHGPQWARQNDNRVTGVGKFLRKTRLDEIPQLVNIIKGEMSLIGPRPERPEFVEQLKQSIPFYRERLLIKPGLTGWAQVVGPSYGGSTQESLEKLQYDLFYIKNRSIGLDISIVLKTIKTILTRKGQ